MKISLVMIVKNGERSLERCLRMAAPLVDEIIIADTGSEDRTREIGESMGAAVLDYQWTNDFSAARNFALAHSHGDWNLVLDADEYLRPFSRGELEKAVEEISEGYGNGWIGTITRYNGYRDKEGISVNVSADPRFLPSDARYGGIIHEQPEGEWHYVRLPLEADHDGYLYQDKGERNLSYLRTAVQDNPEDPYYQFQLGATLRNLERYEESLPCFRAFYRQCSVDSGAYYRVEGVLLYLYTLLDMETQECLMEAETVIEEENAILGNRPDFCFVRGLFYMKLVLLDVAAYIGYLPKIEESYLRCLELGENPRLGGVVGTGSFKASYNLGAWYEVSGQMEKAKYYYELSADLGYEPAKERLRLLES